MLNNLPNLTDFKNLLKYQPGELIDDVDDAVFHLGVVSVTTASLGIITESSVDSKNLHDYFAGLLITSVHRINELIGVEGYDELIKAYNHPMIVKRETKC